MTLERRIDYVKWKLWSFAYGVSWYVFGNLPITYDIKHLMNMAYTRYTLHRDHKK